MPTYSNPKDRFICVVVIALIVPMLLVETMASQSWAQMLDLAVSMERENPDLLFAPGREITYLIRYENLTSSYAAPDVRVIDTLPDYTSALHTDGIYHDRRVVWFFDILQYCNGTFALTLRINDDAPLGSTVTNKTTIMNLDPEINLNNNEYIITETVATPLTTLAVTFISGAGAQSGGDIVSEAGATVIKKGCCWSDSPNPIMTDNCTDDGSGSDSFTSNIKGLSPDTTYYVRAYAIYEIDGSLSVAYGDQEMFTIDASLFDRDGDSDGGCFISSSTLRGNGIRSCFLLSKLKQNIKKTLPLFVRNRVAAVKP